MSTSPRPPARFSLRRLIAVTAVIGVLIGLCLPAVKVASKSRRIPAGWAAESTKLEAISTVAFSASPAPLAAGGSVAARAAVPAEAATDAVPPVQSQTATAGRKIIYDARVELVTEDLNKLEADLLKLVQARGAYVADSERSGAVGSSRRGSWKVRVPVEGYEAFVRGATGLGELVSTRAQSEDVSAEYFDLDARLNAKKVEEARLLKHLSDSTGRLDEILAVERELSRVRSEIERMQGRLAVLSNQVALATVTVSAAEYHGYVPPESPTLGHRVARTFAASVESLQVVGENTLLWAVALAPWAPFLLVAALLVLFLIRRARVSFAGIARRDRG